MASILNHRGELPTITASSLYRNTNPPPQQQPQYTVPILHEPIPYLKSSQSFSDELNAILGEDTASVIDYSTMPEYPSRLKLSEFEDDPESIFMTSAKVATQKASGMQMFDGVGEKQHDDRSVESAGKHMDEKIEPADLSLPYEDCRFLNGYSHFYKTSMYDSQFGSFGPFGTPLGSFIPDIDSMKKDMQLLEKTLESKYLCPEDFENKENDRQVILLE